MMEIHRGDIWYYENKVMNCGNDEMQGRCVQGRSRPVLIVSNEMCNRFSDTVSVVPLTGVQKRSDLPVHTLVQPTDKEHEHSVALCEQITTVNRERLVRKLGECTREQMSAVDACLCIQLGIVPGRLKRGVQG